MYSEVKRPHDGNRIIFKRNGDHLYDLDGKMVARIDGDRVYDTYANVGAVIAYMDGDIVRQGLSHESMGRVHGDSLCDVGNATPILNSSDRMSLAAACALLWDDDSLRCASQDGRYFERSIKFGVCNRADRGGNDMLKGESFTDMWSNDTPEGKHVAIRHGHNNDGIVRRNPNIWLFQGSHYYPPKNMNGKVAFYSDPVCPSDRDALVRVTARAFRNLGYDPVEESRKTMKHFGIEYDDLAYLSFLQMISYAMGQIDSTPAGCVAVMERNDKTALCGWKRYWLMTMGERISEGVAHEMVKYCHERYLKGRYLVHSGGRMVDYRKSGLGMVYIFFMIILLLWFSMTFPNDMPIFFGAGMLGLTVIYFKFFRI